MRFSAAQGYRRGTKIESRDIRQLIRNNYVVALETPTDHPNTDAPRFMLLVEGLTLRFVLLKYPHFGQLPMHRVSKVK